jgi:hypothetical protein
VDPLEVDPRGIVDALAVTASELGEEGAGPTLLRHALVTDPAGDLLAHREDLAALHHRWQTLSSSTGASRGQEAGNSGVWGRMTRRVERTVVALWRRQPDYVLQREMLGELIRVVDALAQRSDELAQSLYEFETVMSQDLTRLSALVAAALPRTGPTREH